MTTVITGEMALELLRQAVEERGEDFVYSAPGGKGSLCFYYHRDTKTPGCIVGLALAKAGIDPAALDDQFSVAADFAGKVVGDFEISEEAADIFQVAQSVQDGSKPWGAALEAAVDMYHDLAFEAEA